MKTLTDIQVLALEYAITHKGFVSDSKAKIPQKTLKALADMGLLVFQGKSYSHGELPRTQYRLTEKGLQVARIGRMFAKMM